MDRQTVIKYLVKWKNFTKEQEENCDCPMARSNLQTIIPLQVMPSLCTARIKILCDVLKIEIKRKSGHCYCYENVNNLITSALKQNSILDNE